ncbi:hypothetical protein ACNI3K_00980 [Demequina sp. SO4-13]
MGTITARFAGHTVHLDVKKVGRIPDSGGHRAHGRSSAQHRASDRAKTSGAKGSYVFLHSMIDDYFHLAYAEPLEDEKAATTIGFCSRARAFLKAHGIDRFVRVVTANGANYRAAVAGHPEHVLPELLRQRFRHEEHPSSSNLSHRKSGITSTLSSPRRGA